MSTEKKAMDDLASTVHQLIRNRWEHYSNNEPGRQHYETYLVQFIKALLADEELSIFDHVIGELLETRKGSKLKAAFDNDINTR